LQVKPILSIFHMRKVKLNFYYHKVMPIYGKICICLRISSLAICGPPTLVDHKMLQTIDEGEMEKPEPLTIVAPTNALNGNSINFECNFSGQ
jgi:hypothetical protein